MKVKIQTTDKISFNVSLLLKTVKAAKRSYVTIGLHEGAGTYPESPGGTTASPSVVEVGLWNEFGTKSIPERSWIRSAIDGNVSKINELREQMALNILTKNWTVQKALEKIGFEIQNMIQNKIRSNVPPPLAESTAKAKQDRGVAPVTLIDTHLLHDSVTYKVVIQ